MCLCVCRYFTKHVHVFIRGFNFRNFMSKEDRLVYFSSSDGFLLALKYESVR